MNEVTVSTPYDVIIQQQIDIIDKQQKDILTGKEGVSISDLHESIAQLQNIRACVPDYGRPFIGAGTFGASFPYSRLKDQLKDLKGL